jgi:hypothetical protein
MSSNSNDNSDMKLELFKEKVTSLLEVSYISFIALGVVGLGLYLSFLPKNIQNSLPVLLIIFLGTFSWIMRAKIKQVDASEIRIYVWQWIILCVIVIVGTVIAILLYPY